MNGVGDAPGTRLTTLLEQADRLVERQAVAEGDYVKVGDLLFTLVGTRVLRAQLPPAWQGAPRGLRGCAPR